MPTTLKFCLGITAISKSNPLQINLAREKTGMVKVDAMELHRTIIHLSSLNVKYIASKHAVATFSIMR